MLYGRVLIKIVKDGTECAIEEEQCGFRKVKGYMDQLIALRQCVKSIRRM